MNSALDQTDILQRFQTLIEEDLSEAEIEQRIQTDFTAAEQAILTDTLLGAIAASEGEKYMNQSL